MRWITPGVTDMIDQPVFTLTNIQRQFEEALARLLEPAAMAHFVDPSLSIAEPYLGSGEIKLVIIGQDPTVQRATSWKHIHTVLNLDRQRGLWTYLNKLCQNLGLSLAENVCATNACKSFFTFPPTEILKREGVDVFGNQFFHLAADPSRGSGSEPKYIGSSILPVYSSTFLSECLGRFLPKHLARVH